MHNKLSENYLSCHVTKNMFVLKLMLKGLSLVLLLEVMGSCLEGQGTYNSFIQQVGFCKQQGFDTVSRQTSHAPPVFLDGRVWIGVGLSNVEFQDTTASCGRCLNVSAIENFWTLGDDLTTWDYDTPWPSDRSFLAMVMDRCADPICTSGFLDFDVYDAHQPTRYGNPHGVVWSFVPCPVGNDPIELLVCLGPFSCQVDFPEGRMWEEVWQDALRTGYFSMYVRNTRLPVTGVHVHVEGEEAVALRDAQGWQFSGFGTVLDGDWLVKLLSIEGVVRTTTLRWTQYDMTQATSPGYRGGLLLLTDIQV